MVVLAFICFYLQAILCLKFKIKNCVPNPTYFAAKPMLLTRLGKEDRTNLEALFFFPFAALKNIRCIYLFFLLSFIGYSQGDQRAIALLDQVSEVYASYDTMQMRFSYQLDNGGKIRSHSCLIYLIYAANIVENVLSKKEVDRKLF